MRILRTPFFDPIDQIIQALDKRLTFQNVQDRGLKLENLDDDAIDRLVPWVVPVFVDRPVANQGNWTRLISNTNPYNMIVQNNVSAAQFDYGEYLITLAKGIYTLNWYGTKDFNRGIITFKLGTVPTIAGPSIGTIDQYNAAGQSNQFGAISNIAVAKTGRYVLRAQADTKNGASAGYVIDFSRIYMERAS